MSFSFNSQIEKSKKYSIQIETDNYEQFIFMQEMARQCVDGKHKQDYNPSRLATFEDLSTYESLEGTYIPECCRTCPTNPSNGGSGICNCTLPSYFVQSKDVRSDEFKYICECINNGKLPSLDSCEESLYTHKNGWT